MPRLFTGLEIPEDVAMRLSLLRGGLPGARWIDEENYHITLRFIGDIDARMADEVAFALSRIQRPQFSIALDGLDFFGGSKPHSVWARVLPSPELMELQAEQERILQRLGLPPEGRKYTPHITLARCKNASASDVAHWLAMRGGFQAKDIACGRFVLFSARDSVGGGPYLVEEAYLLGPEPVA